MDEKPGLSSDDVRARVPAARVRPPRAATAALPRRILIGCSDPLLGEALLQVLRHHVEDVSPGGLDIRCVMDGVSCLQQVEMNPPDLLILGTRLDRMDGAEVLAAWRAAHPGSQLPVLVLSTAFGSDAPEGVSPSCVLQVPCENADLVDRVARALVSA